jgi:hypothetical protein
MVVPRATQALALRAGQPHGIGSEAYLNGTSQRPTPEDARLPARFHWSLGAGPGQESLPGAPTF